jgi:cell division protein FtsW
MPNLFKYVEGDKALWAAVALLGLISFLPVYSASSNLVFLYGQSSTLSYLFKHASLLFIGFSIMYGIHKIPYNYFSGLSVIVYPVALLLLIYTATQGNTIAGANASRWIQIPYVGISFQTSTFAIIVLISFVARFLARHIQTELTFRRALMTLWLPVGLMLAFVLPANFSTTAIAFLLIVVLAYIGNHPVKHIAKIMGFACLALTLFILVAKAFPNMLPNRVDTWINRIENFVSDENVQDDYQADKAKTAIATGGLIGLGPGKSIQKNFLPQSSSDFIYAIIAEEFGMVGAIFLLSLYLFILFRVLIIARRASTNFGKLIVIGLGLSIILQAFINMGVAVGLFPVTGQTLPLLSAGGTSLWMTCVSLGIILSVSANRISARNKAVENEEALTDETEGTNPIEVFSEPESMNV